MKIESVNQNLFPYKITNRWKQFRKEEYKHETKNLILTSQSKILELIY